MAGLPTYEVTLTPPLRNFEAGLRRLLIFVFAVVAGILLIRDSWFHLAGVTLLLYAFGLICVGLTRINGGVDENDAEWARRVLEAITTLVVTFLVYRASEPSAFKTLADARFIYDLVFVVAILLQSRYSIRQYSQSIPYEQLKKSLMEQQTKIVVLELAVESLSNLSSKVPDPLPSVDDKKEVIDSYAGHLLDELTRRRFRPQEVTVSTTLEVGSTDLQVSVRLPKKAHHSMTLHISDMKIRAGMAASNLFPRENSLISEIVVKVACQQLAPRRRKLPEGLGH